MPITAESLQRLFDESVGRPAPPPPIAEAAAGLAGMLVGGLNMVDPETLFPVEPSLAFEAGYRDRDEEAKR